LQSWSKTKTVKGILMNIKDRAKALFLQGKSVDEVTDILVSEFATATASEIKDALATGKSEAEKLSSVKALIEDDKKKADFHAAVKAEVEATLKTIDTGSNYSGNSVKVAHNWQAEAAEYMKLLSVKEKNVEQITRMSELREKSETAYKHSAKTLGFEVGTDASGGYFMQPEFDMEVDKAIYTQSALLNEIRVRQGGEKTEINSMSTFDLTLRTNEDTAFTTKTVTFAQEELKYRDAGGLMSIGNDALAGSSYDIIKELTEQTIDSKIRYLEQIILTGLSASEGFNGIHFTSGIGSTACIATQGTGGVESKDLTNLWGAVGSVFRANAKFVMNTLEFIRLSDERDDKGQPTNRIITVNGKFYHAGTGKEIVISDLGYRSLNGVTNKTAGSNVPVICGDLSKFRFYQNGGTRIKTSKDFYFDKDALALLVAIRFKQGIPTQAKPAFATLTGVKSIAL